MLMTVPVFGNAAMTRCEAWIKLGSKRGEEWGHILLRAKIHEEAVRTTPL